MNLAIHTAVSVQSVHASMHHQCNYKNNCREFLQSKMYHFALKIYFEIISRI